MPACAVGRNRTERASGGEFAWQAVKCAALRRWLPPPWLLSVENHVQRADGGENIAERHDPLHGRRGEDGVLDPLVEAEPVNRVDQHQPWDPIFNRHRGGETARGTAEQFEARMERDLDAGDQEDALQNASISSTGRRTSARRCCARPDCLPGADLDVAGTSAEPAAFRRAGPTRGRRAGSERSLILTGI